MNLTNHSLTTPHSASLIAEPKHFTVYEKDRGFTLIELMIALILGLLISAAALQIFYTSSVNSRRQEASSQIQDNATFSFSQMQQNIRRANYGAKSTSAHDEFFMNHLTPQGGVVLTAPAGSSGKWLDGNLSGLVLNSAAISSDLLSNSSSTTSISNLNGIANSDQLTIQYQSGQVGSFDCEGDEIPENFYVIERYFVRMDSTVSPAASALACASAIYKYDETVAGSATGIDIKDYTVPGESTKKANNLQGDGTVIIPNVDYFRVMLGVSESTGFATYPEDSLIGYMAIPSAASLTTSLADRRIVSLQLGILARSDNPTATEQANNELRFTVLDKTNATLNSAAIAGPTYLRNVYETTVLLRNARGGL